MMGKAPISTGLRRQAAGDACIVGTIGAREDGSGAENRRTTAAAIEDLLKTNLIRHAQSKV